MKKQQYDITDSRVKQTSPVVCIDISKSNENPEGRSMDRIGAEVTLHNVAYSIAKKKSRKPVLLNISGKYPCGLNAILGPTGCGKTSLLDLIAGRKDPKWQTGTVLVDGKSRPDNFRRCIGYVIQDDVVYGTLTVKENIAFSANLRLGTKISKDEKEKLVDTTLLDLGLMHCADSKVGTIYIRGVSGGERKRTKIGMELVISPKVMFLDEPTTGLDASTADALLHTLKTLASHGHTIIFSIHQPRYSIFKLFDQITLLSMGRLIYHGPANRSIEYFENMGFQCEEHNNPADFFLDVINSDSTAIHTEYSTDPLSEERSLPTETSIALEPTTSNDQPRETIDGHVDKVEDATIAETLEANFKSSQIYISQKGELDNIYDEFEKDQTAKVHNKQNHASFSTQVKCISKRNLLNILRNPATYVTQICVVIVFALLTGGIYFQLDDTITQGIPNRAGVVFFIVMSQIFQNLSAVDVFIRERAFFIHEYAAGFYGCFAYFLSKVLCDIIPMRLQPIILFSIISYFMIGFQMNVAKFFIYLLTLFLTTLGALSVSFFASASINVFGIANLLVALVFVFMMVFSGFLVKLSTVGWWIRWVSYISIFKYSMSALLINEMENMSFCETVNGTKYCDSQAGNNFLQYQEIDYGTSWDLWKNEVALVAISLLLLFFSYIQLRLIKKTT